MADLNGAAARFGELARALREVGEGGLRKELYQAVSEAAKPLARDLRDVERLKGFFPDPYAAVLARDLQVTTSKRSGKDPGVSVQARGRVKKRHVQRLNRGVLTHCFFGDRTRWFAQTKKVEPGFFTDAVREAAPELRRQVEQAMERVSRQLYRFTRG